MAINDISYSQWLYDQSLDIMGLHIWLKFYIDHPD